MELNNKSAKLTCSGLTTGNLTVSESLICSSIPPSDNCSKSVCLNDSTPATTFHNLDDFDKIVLGNDYLEAVNRYFARNMLIDRVNNTITIIYLNTLADIYAVKYYETHVERQKYSLLRKIISVSFVETNTQPNYDMITIMLNKFSMPIGDIMTYSGKSVFIRSAFNEYAIRDIYRVVPYFRQTQPVDYCSTEITNAYLLDRVLMMTYYIFDMQTLRLRKQISYMTTCRDNYIQQNCALSADLANARHNCENLQSKITDLESALQEEKYDNSAVKEKLLQSEQELAELMSSGTSAATGNDIQAKVDKLTAENTQLRAAMSNFQSSMAALSKAMYSMESHVEQK